MSDPETRARVSQKRKRKIADKERNRRDLRPVSDSVLPRTRIQRTQQIGFLGEETEDARDEHGYPYDFDFNYSNREFDLDSEE